MSSHTQITPAPAVLQHGSTKQRGKDWGVLRVRPDTTTPPDLWALGVGGGGGGPGGRRAGVPDTPNIRASK